jgi:hypothetical protein
VHAEFGPFGVLVNFAFIRLGVEACLILIVQMERCAFGRRKTFREVDPIFTPTCYNIRFKSIKCNAGVNAVVYPRPNCQGDVAAVLGVGQADSNINGQSVTIQRIIFSPT